MMYRVMRIDPRSVTPIAVTFAAGVLTINIRQRPYNSGCPYFLRLVDEIPDTATVGAEVVITIGAGTVTYPLVDCTGAPVTVEKLRTGYSYPVAVIDSGADGAFKVLAPLAYSPYRAAFSVGGTEGGDDADG